jgi:hypothetical protein
MYSGAKCLEVAPLYADAADYASSLHGYWRQMLKCAPLIILALENQIESIMINHLTSESMQRVAAVKAGNRSCKLGVKSSLSSQPLYCLLDSHPIVLIVQKVSASSHFFGKGLFADETRAFTNWFSLWIVIFACGSLNPRRKLSIFL